MQELNIETTVILTCPECGTKHKVTMPINGRQHFFKCSNEQCLADIYTKKEDPCVFCTYSNKKCPAEQLNPTQLTKSKLKSLI